MDPWKYMAVNRRTRDKKMNLCERKRISREIKNLFPVTRYLSSGQVLQCLTVCEFTNFALMRKRNPRCSLGDVIRDLSVYRIVMHFVQCREFRASKAQSAESMRSPSEFLGWSVVNVASANFQLAMNNEEWRVKSEEWRVKWKLLWCQTRY